MASIRRIRDKWQLRWRDPDGTERTRFCPSKKDAKVLAREVEVAHALGHRWEPRDVRSEDLEARMIAFLEDGKRVYKPGTLRRIFFALKLAKRFALSTLGRPLVARDLTLGFLRDFYAWLLVPANGLHGRVRTPETARKNVSWLQTFWRWVFNNAAEGTVPMPRELEMVSAPAKRTVAPTWAEMDACIAACATEWHRQLATVLRFTGLRVNQAMRLRWGDVDFDACTLTIRSELGKTRSEMQGRVVPLSKHLAKILRRWVETAGDASLTVVTAYIINSNRQPGSGRERVARDRDMARAWARAQVREAAWKTRPHHAFRKGFVTGLEDAGADPQAVEFLVGHSAGLRGIYLDPRALKLKLARAAALVPALTKGKTK